MNAGDTDSMGRISASQLKGWVFGPTAAERIAVALHGQERSPQNLGKKKKIQALAAARCRLPKSNVKNVHSKRKNLVLVR